MLADWISFILGTAGNAENSHLVDDQGDPKQRPEDESRRPHRKPSFAVGMRPRLRHGIKRSTIRTAVNARRLPTETVEQDRGITDIGGRSVSCHDGGREGRRRSDGGRQNDITPQGNHCRGNCFVAT